MIVSVEMIRAIQDMRVLVNLEQLEDLELYEDGKKLDIPIKFIDEFKFTGLSNIDFITSGAYKIEHVSEQENPYLKHKNTCTDCDKGPCDRTLHNPCDAELSLRNTPGCKDNCQQCDIRCMYVKSIATLKEEGHEV